MDGSKLDFDKQDFSWTAEIISSKSQQKPMDEDKQPPTSKDVEADEMELSKPVEKFEAKESSSATENLEMPTKEGTQLPTFKFIKTCETKLTNLVKMFDVAAQQGILESDLGLQSSKDKTPESRVIKTNTNSLNDMDDKPEDLDDEASYSRTVSKIISWLQIPTKEGKQPLTSKGTKTFETELLKLVKKFDVAAKQGILESHLVLQLSEDKSPESRDMTLGTRVGIKRNLSGGPAKDSGVKRQALLDFASDKKSKDIMI